MRNYKVFRVKDEMLKIVGSGDDVLWEEAEILSDFISPWDSEEVQRIEFRAIYDSQNLYFLFKVFDNQVYVAYGDESIESIGNSDRVELFFRTDEGLNPYYCLEIDPIPRIMDFKAFPNKEFDFGWNWPKDEIYVKSKIQKDFFTVEGSISLDSLRRFDLIKENKIEAGIFRAKFNKTEDNSYAPTWISWVDPETETPNFHIASSFGVLHLIDQK